MREMVEIDGTRLAVEVTGRDNGPWIVLSNGLGTTMAMWQPQLMLLEAHRRVLRYDTRGLGQSDVPAGPYTLDRLVSDVIALMDHFDIASADVMGLSLGGRTVMGVGLDHPDRVDRLIVADTRADTPPDQHEIWAARAALVRDRGMAALWTDSRDRWFTRDSIGRNAEIIAGFEHGFTSTSVEGFVACAAALRQTDYLRRLHRLAVPTLFIGGESDTGAPPDLMREMADRAPGSTHVTIPLASHLANIDNAADFNAAIAGFLGIGYASA